MRIEYRRPIGRKTGLAKDAGALRVLARAADMREHAEAVRVAVAGDPPPGRSALDAMHERPKPWLDPAKISAAGNLEWGSRRERWVRMSGGDE